VALSCATFLLASENLLFSPLRKSFTSLMAALTTVLPRITEAQLLSDLHHQMKEQSERFQAFCTDLPRHLASSFNAATGPVLAKIGCAVENLATVMKTEQNRYHESTGDRLEGLLLNVQKSLQVSLEEMALRLNDSLSGTTREHLNGVLASLEGAGALLEQVNAQFQKNQSVLHDFMNLAKNTTSDQMAMGRTQAEQLTALLVELMGRLQEKTGESINSIERTVSQVTSEISHKVTDLTAHMAKAVQESSETSVKSARQLLEEAGALNSRTALHLARLMEKHGAELTKVEELKALLENTLREFNTALNGYGQATADLQKLASGINETVASLHGVAKLVNESQQAAMRVSMSAADHLESARVFSLTQREVWTNIQESMIHYESLFQRVEGHARELLTQIGLHLGNYSDSTQKHFSQLTSAANNFIAEATGRLAGSVDELGEQLDELQTSVAGLVQVSKAMVRHAAA